MADIAIRNLATILADPSVLVPPPIVVPGFAWKERLTVVAAREKLGKSTLAAYAAARVTNCEPFAGGQTLGPTVLWASAEEHEADIAQRAVAFRTAPANLYVLTDRGEDGLTVLGDAVAQVKPELVVVDALESWCEGAFQDANSSAELGTVMSALRRIARRGPAVWVQHHANKSDGSYRGSSAIGAGCDVLIEMFTDDADSAARLFKPKGRIRGLTAFTMRFEGNVYRLQGGELSPDDRAIGYVQSEPDISLTKLREKIGGGHGTADRAIRSMVARGLLVDETTSGGHHRFRLPGQRAGLRLGVKTSPEPRSATPHAASPAAGSSNLPVSQTPGEAVSEPPFGTGDAREKPAA